MQTLIAPDIALLTRSPTRQGIAAAGVTIDGYVSEPERVEEVVEPMAAHQEASNEVGKNDNPDGYVDELQDRTPVDE